VERIKKILLLDVFPFLCRLVGSGLIFLAVYSLGMPLPSSVAATPISLLVIGTFFLLLPIAKKISIGKLLTFEREIEQVRHEVKEAKLEINQSLSAYSSMVSAVSNSINQNVNVHFHPEREGRRQAQEEIKKATSDVSESTHIADKVDDFVESADNDFNYALAKLRMELERSMRETLGLVVENNNPAGMRSGHLSARQMFRQLMNRSPRFVDMHHSFDYVTKVCNAAIHGQQVLVGHAQEAIQMGVVLLEEIRKEGRPKQF
jgi:hypothetical protein